MGRPGPRLAKNDAFFLASFFFFLFLSPPAPGTVTARVNVSIDLAGRGASGKIQRAPSLVVCVVSLPVPPPRDPGAAVPVVGGPELSGRWGLRAAARCLLQNSLEAKDGSGSAHAGIAPAAAYYPYDHTLSQYQYDR